MSTSLTLGFSPCPNDTFIFDALVNHKIDTKGLNFEVLMEDVETLNLWASEGRLDITKLSYHSYLHHVTTYALLQSGSALGKGVGPLLIAKEAVEEKNVSTWLEGKNICIPGFHTTANLLLSLAFPSIKNKTALVFHEIEQAVISGDFDAGLIIHENRFTYQAKGLHKLMDLGDWWEMQTQAPIPLGGIVMKRNFPIESIALVDRLLQESIAYAWSQYPLLSPFVTCNAQEMQESVMRQHIELYVNDYTTHLGEDGAKAVAVLFEKALQAKMISILPKQLFY